MKATAYLILATRHRKKSGKFSVKVRVVFQRISKDFKTGLDLTEDEYKMRWLNDQKVYIKI